MAELPKVVRIGDTLTNLIDKNTNQTITYTKVNNWWDGTPMTADKADGEIYRRKGVEYFLKNLGKYGELFLEKDTMQEMRDLNSTEILLLLMGYYKGVKLNGYYAKGDTPAPIEYYINETSESDDGGSVIEVGGVKLVHEFVGSIAVEYFGAIGDGIFDCSESFSRIRDYARRTTYDRGNTNVSVGIVFSKKYSFQESPNWAIQNLRLETEGFPELICTGDGMVLNLWFDNPSSSPSLGRGVSNMKVGDFLLTGNENTQVICGIRAVSRSTFGTIMAREGNSLSGSAFMFSAGVCNVFNKLICSHNTNYGMVNKPYYGMRFTNNPELGRTTAVAYNMIVMEGVHHGVYMDNSSADLCTFNQGTSEGNATGVFIGTRNRNNVFIDLAMEVNTDYDITDRGTFTVIEGGYSQGGIRFEGAKFSKISRIRTQSISVDSSSNGVKISDLSINNWNETAIIREAGIFNSSSTTEISRVWDAVKQTSQDGILSYLSGSQTSKYNTFIGDNSISPNNIINTYETSASGVTSITFNHNKDTINGSLVIIKNNGGGVLNLVNGSGVTITGAPSTILSLVGQGSSIILQASSVTTNSTNYRVISIIAKASQEDVNSGDNFKYITSNRLFQKGTTGERPISPVIGFNRFNTTLGHPEWFDGTLWRPSITKVSASPDTATQASGETPTKAEFDALLAELRDLKNKMRAGDAPILSS